MLGSCVQTDIHKHSGLFSINKLNNLHILGNLDCRLNIYYVRINIISSLIQNFLPYLVAPMGMSVIFMEHTNITVLENGKKKN